MLLARDEHECLFVDRSPFGYIRDNGDIEIVVKRDSFDDVSRTFRLSPTQLRQIADYIEYSNGDVDSF